MTNRFDAKHFPRRPETDEYSSPISTTAPAQDEITAIIKEVFHHKPACFQPTLTTIATDRRRDLSLSQYFYEHCYRPPRIRLNRGAEVSIEQLIARAFVRRRDDNRNHLSFIRGNVGVGKTSLMNYLITKYGHKWTESNQYWFVRVDIEISTVIDTPLTDTALLQQCVRKTISVLDANKDMFKHSPSLSYAKQEAAKALSHAKSFDDLAPAFTALCSVIRDETGRRLLLIVDNVDFICHQMDRRLFDPTAQALEYKHLLAIVTFISKFRHDTHSLDRCRATVVFCVRDDTYDLLQHAEACFSHREFLDDQSVFDVESPKWETALDSRSQLLNYAVKGRGEHIRRQCSNVIALITKQMSYQSGGTPTLSDHVDKLSNFGLRAIMSFFENYSWLRFGGTEQGERHDQVVHERILNANPVGLLTYILDGNRRFSQKRCTFPNIYLVDCSQSTTAEKSHNAHSYWLKRLLLEFIRRRDANNEATTINDVLDTFASGDAAYEEHAVRECMGSLTDATESWLLEVKRKANAQRAPLAGEITLNSRGQHFATHVMDTFCYLQLVVDDHMLRIPRAVLPEFAIKPPDYSYIVLSGRPYREQLENMLKHKSLQVIRFIELLRVSLEIERDLYFQAFDSIKDSGLQIPDMNVISGCIESELRAVFHSLNIDLDPMVRFPKKSTLFSNLRYKDLLRDSYKEGFNARSR